MEAKKCTSPLYILQEVKKNLICLWFGRAQKLLSKNYRLTQWGPARARRQGDQIRGKAPIPGKRAASERRQMRKILTYMFHVPY